MKPLIDRLHEKFSDKEINKADIIPDIQEWKLFLNNLPEAKDSIDAAFNKYQCRMHYFPWYKRLLVNFLGLCVLPVEIFFMVKSNQPVSKMNKGTAILEKSRDVPVYEDTFPKELYNEYNIIVVENFNKKFDILCKEARKILIKCIKRHPFNFFFIYFVYMELAAHSHFLLKYNPEATIVYVNERNIASPVITRLYENDGRKLISFMHGEYLLQLVQGFMTFSRYYILDKSYENMFKWLKCNMGQYIVYTPGKLQKKWKFDGNVTKFYCTYYLSGQSKESILCLGSILEKFEAQGKKCKVRPHPRDIQYTKEILTSFRNITIEDANKVSLKESLENTKYVIGLNTTVLSEAYVEGKQIVIDDLSDRGRFLDAKRRGAIAFKKEHLLLSELL